MFSDLLTLNLPATPTFRKTNRNTWLHFKKNPSVWRRKVSAQNHMAQAGGFERIRRKSFNASLTVFGGLLTPMPV